MEEQRGYNTIVAKHCIRGHGKPANQAYACHLLTLWEKLHSEGVVWLGFDTVENLISPSGL